jgi:hypothetical protein
MFYKPSIKRTESHITKIEMKLPILIIFLSAIVFASSQDAGKETFEVKRLLVLYNLLGFKAKLFGLWENSSSI